MMADAEDKLRRLKAAVQAFLLSTEECKRRYEELESEIEAAVDPLTAMSQEEFGQFRDELRAQLETATGGRQDPLSAAELDSMIDSTFKRLVPKVLYFLGEHVPDDVELADSQGVHPFAVGKTCQRCDQRATFRTTNLVDREWVELHFCERHAREYLTGN